ncbi:ROK family protein [Noviherbaspirillum cavernae]|uniref:ROK family protein n=1 Tax=Noviherbaspirillum cavernae TaxID=2320862 RepID=A0A418X0Z9_9BURK|nr:ROK family protein [Noviherbaspirillum cavernae]RJG06112.1 ROK family protein [Noviherbaspirillum cavernae]
MESLLVGALDIGGTKIAASVADVTGPLARVSQATIKTGTPRAVPEQAIALLKQACDKAGIDFNRLQTVGVGSCGPFVANVGMIELATPNICGGLGHRTDLPNDWTVIPLERVLRERFQHVVIENDCVTALMAERTFGAVQDAANCVYVTWSTGIGFGLCVDGNVLRGKHGNAGHAGHMLLNPESAAECGCGNRGDLESLISGRNLSNAHGIPAPELFQSARDGEPAARAIVVEAARWLGRALYNLTITLDTSVFVVGGSVWLHHGDWLGPIVMQEVESRLQALTKGVSIVPAGLANFVADIGAFSLAMPPAWIAEWRKSAPWQAFHS